ncbi:FMN-dependent dehydrogenase [Xylaria bambusicola]|uniref:FMN-dependent dehydrogenase n=1 Tax=Xylaria bambusicola TaxID=326684 RepID=UPI00200857F5|nr:FMN-dependent dehydrogenase [Xylaria bambusicola]KAI0526195.1 FMN-dependent dehydrogenase [Xylaria bambusicola]
MSMSPISIKRELFWAPNEDKHPLLNNLDTQSQDTVTTIFGHRVSAPIGLVPLSPVGVAGELNLSYCLSSAGSYSIEAVAKANDALVSSGLSNNANGASINRDGNGLGWRHDDMADRNYAFYKRHGVGDLGLVNEEFTKHLNRLGLLAEKQPKNFGAQLPWLMENWRQISEGKPFMLKGPQSAANARKAVEMGVDSIVVDEAIVSLDALEKIVGAVGDKTYVMFDSGIPGGVDVFKALALGAKFVFVGHLWVYALGYGGEGVRHIMKGLLADFDILISVAGNPNLLEINRDALDSKPRGAYFPPT